MRDERYAVRALRMEALCGPCRAEWLRWLDYRSPRRQRWIVKYGGSPVRLSLDNFEILARRWRETIRAQQELIEAHCAAGHGGAVTLTALWSQGSLFDALGGEAS